MIRSRPKMPEPIHLSIQPPASANPELGLTGFEADVSAVVRAFRKALTRVVEALPGDNRRPADLQKSLKLDWKICWQISNVTRFSNPMAVVPNIPTLASLKRFLSAAENTGVSSDLTAAVLQAYQRFDQIVATHASDRAEFDSMAASMSPGETGASTELVHRRNAYRAQSHIWGIQQDVLCVTNMLRHSGDGGANEISVETKTDKCYMVSKLGLRRLRAGAQMSVIGYGRIQPPGFTSPLVRNPLDTEAAERYGASVIPQFCSQPLQQFDISTTPQGLRSVDVRNDAVGRLSSVNLTFGDVMRGMPIHKTEQGVPRWEQAGWMSIPARLFILDFFVHRPSFGAVTPKFQIFRAVPGETLKNIDVSGIHLPVREQVSMLGSGADAVATPDVPRYPSLIEYACRTLSWNPDEFDTYRLRIEYPPLDVIVQMYFDGE